MPRDWLELKFNMTSSCKILWKQAGRYWKMLKVWAFQRLLEIIRVWRRRNCRGSCLATFDGNATRSLNLTGWPISLTSIHAWHPYYAYSPHKFLNKILSFPVVQYRLQCGPAPLHFVANVQLILNPIWQSARPNPETTNGGCRSAPEKNRPSARRQPSARLEVAPAQEASCSKFSCQSFLNIGRIGRLLLLENGVALT